MSTPSEHTNQLFRDHLAQASRIEDFVPRNKDTEPSTRQRQCSHQSSHSDDTCALDKLLNVPVQVTTPPTPALKAEGSEGLSSSGSSSSLHTQSGVSGTGINGWYGPGQNWISSPISSPIWTPPVSTPITMKTSKYATTRSTKSSKGSQGSQDDYHLVKMADKYGDDDDFEREQADKDPMFNPTLARPRSSFSTPPAAGHAAFCAPYHPHTQPNRPVLDRTQMSQEQLANLFAALSTTGIPPCPQVAGLVAQADRLAKGLAKPPPNRGFRPRANETLDNDENNTTVFVGGLSEGITESILSEVFAPFGTITYVKVPPGKGCGFVQFQEKAHSEYAIKQMQGFEIMGCSLRTHWGRNQSDRSMPSAPSVEFINAQVLFMCSMIGIPQEDTKMVLDCFHTINNNSKKSPAMFGNGNGR